MIKKSLLLSLMTLIFVACSSSNAQGGSGVFSFNDDISLTKRSISDEAASKIAIIVPEKVLKSYSNIIINSSIAYALRQKSRLSIDVYLIGTEDEDKIRAIIRELEEKDYRFFIAGFTLKGANALVSLNTNDLYFYLPLLNKNTANITASNIYFGGIDYDAQIKHLLGIAKEGVVSFYDDSALSSSLNQKLNSMKAGITSHKLEGDKTNFEVLFRRMRLNYKSVFLNTPLVKSAILSSQLRANDVKDYMILSTQIGYNPTFLSLTQPEDRSELFIANSIANDDVELSYLNEMLGLSVDYNWVAYATSLGVDYFYTQVMNTRSKRLFKEEMQNNQILYTIRTMRAFEGSFSEE